MVTSGTQTRLVVVHGAPPATVPSAFIAIPPVTISPPQPTTLPQPQELAQLPQGLAQPPQYVVQPPQLPVTPGHPPRELPPPIGLPQLAISRYVGFKKSGDASKLVSA
ncbi:MAG: hypothetical protein O3C60_17770, partial [Planctomycetota bacterium]|nr:hypothetical protein [Planctomycetota bacterium]